MEFQTLKRSHLKRNIIIGIMIIGIISAVVLNFTRAKYKNTQSIPLVTGTINYSLADLNIVAITVDGNEVDTIPEGNYELTDESYCTVNGEKDSSIKLSYDSATQGLSVTPMTSKGTKCYLDFNRKLTAGETILLNKDIQTREDFSTTLTTDTTGIVYQAEDWLGTTYYFAGAPKDNWISFGGYYWRIIRINGNGSIRLIYSGTSTATTGAGTQISTGVFNSSNNYSYYVGLSYDSTQHGKGNESIVLTTLNSWYKTNLLNYAEYIDDTVGFCSDRNMASGYSWSAAPNSSIRYAAVDRVLNTSASPSLFCSSEDIISIPVGLITADEVVYAGAVYGSKNSSYYLYTNQNYWTMTPFDCNVSGSVVVLRYAYEFIVSSNGMPYYYVVSDSYGIRPVINLSSNVNITGSGTSSDPFVVL